MIAGGFIESIILLNLPLPTGAARLSRMTKRLSRFGLDFLRMECEYPAVSWGFGHPGWHGCYLSHVLALTKAAKQQGNTLILEDDAVFADDFLNVCEKAGSDLKGRTWNMLYLGLFPGVADFGSNQLTPQLASFVRGLETHAYVVNPASAGSIRTRMLSHLGKHEIRLTVDSWYSIHVDRKFHTVPLVAAQEAGFSDVRDCILSGTIGGRDLNSPEAMEFRQRCSELKDVPLQPKSKEIPYERIPTGYRSVSDWERS